MTIKEIIRFRSDFSNLLNIDLDTITERNLRKWIKEGQLPAKKLGRAYTAKKGI